MLGILALASSLVWALYNFKPGLIGFASGAGSGAGAADEKVGVFEMTVSPSSSNGVELAANATTPLLGANQSGANGHGPPFDEANEAPLNRSVNLADHFLPMQVAPVASAPPQSRTATMARAIQTDFSVDDGLLGVSDSASMLGSAAVTRSYNHLAGGAASGAGMYDSANAGTQTGPPPGYNTSVVGGGNTVAYVHGSSTLQVFFLINFTSVSAR